MGNEFNVPTFSIDSIVDEAIRSGPLREQKIVIIYNPETGSENPDILCQIFELLRQKPYEMNIIYSKQKIVDSGVSSDVTEDYASNIPKTSKSNKQKSNEEYKLNLSIIKIDYGGIEIKDGSLDQSNNHLQDILVRSFKLYKVFLDSLRTKVSPSPTSRKYSPGDY